MKYKFFIVFLSIFVACGSSNLDESSSDTSTSTTSTVAQIDESSTTTEVENKFVFNIEKMSPLTGLELEPEKWLMRPRRVIAFKIDNNINARPSLVYRKLILYMKSWLKAV